MFLKRVRFEKRASAKLVRASRPARCCRGKIASRLVAETESEIAPGLEQARVERHGAHAAGRLFERHEAQLTAPERDHAALWGWALGEEPDGGRDQKDVQLQQEENARAMADLLTGEGLEGTSEGDMSKRRPGADLGQQIADVRDTGKQVAVGGGGGRGPRGSGDARVGTTKGTGIETAGTQSTGPKEERAPTGRIQVADKQTFDESSLTPDIVHVYGR